MILQALYEYYERKVSDPDSGIAPLGFEKKEIPFIVVYGTGGKFVTIEDTRSDDKKKTPRSFIVPQQAGKRSAGIKANLLWDNIEYALGANPRQRKDIAKRFDNFKETIRTELSECLDLPAIKALLVFLDNDPVGEIAAKANCNDIWEEIMNSKKSIITFRYDDDDAPTICDIVRQYLINKPKKDSNGFCLITGKKAEIARLHPPVKGVCGANTTGAAVVSFNLPAFRSYGKEQNYNAPIGTPAASAYTTALNLLLSKDSSNRINVADASVVFWAKKKNTEYDLEADFPCVFSDPPKDDPDRNVRAVKEIYQAVHSGIFSAEESTPFFVLGLSPNSARIAVRFWLTGTVAEFADKISRHFDDLEIVKGPKDRDYPCLSQLLRAVALEYKNENIPPNLAGNVIASVLRGTPYPVTLLHQCIRRIRAEQKVTYLRAAILKAYLNRNMDKSNQPNPKKEVTVSLDKNNQCPGYRLGRLFAALEKIQEEANPRINTTIRERFYGAASATPVTVFPQLLKLKNHHLAKMDNVGRKVYFEKMLGEIIDGINGIPAHLPMELQASFAIGYYHQRQAFFEPSEKTAKTETFEKN